MPVERHGLADDIWVCAEASLPTAVTQDRDRMRALGLILFGQERAAEHGRDAEHVEVVATDDVAPDALVSIAVAQAHRREAIDEQPREDVVALTVVFVIQVRLDRIVRAVVLRAINFDQTFRLRDRQRTQEHRINQTEDGRVRANAQSQRQDRQRRKARTLPQTPKAVTNVLPQIVHAKHLQKPRQVTRDR